MNLGNVKMNKVLKYNLRPQLQLHQLHL